MTDPSTYIPIDCTDHDHIEIACLHGYEVALLLRDGGELRGVAKTTKSTSDGEYLVLLTESQTDTNLLNVRLDTLASLKVLSIPRSFDEIVFER